MRFARIGDEPDKVARVRRDDRDRLQPRAVHLGQRLGHDGDPLARPHMGNEGDGRIGLHPRRHLGPRFGEVAVGQMLETVGATLDDVELIDVGFDLMSAMTTGNVDATFGCFINHEVPALEEEGFAVDYMEVMDYGVPNYYALMLVTGEDQLEANRDKYTRFLRACQKGFADMQADPEEALGLLLANQDEENFPLTESVERRSFDVLLPIMETADAPFLSQDVSVWQENIDWLQKVGMIDAAFDPAEVMVDLLAE